MVLGLALCWVVCSVGCAGMNDNNAPNVEIKVGKDALTLDSLELLVGAASQGSCTDFLDKKTAFDKATFTSENTQAVDMTGDVEKRILSIPTITPGDKLFIVAGYANSQLTMLGCATGTIEKGKRLNVSIFLAVL